MSRLKDEEFTQLGLQPPKRRVAIPDGPQTLSELLDICAAETPEREALVGRFSRYDYAQLSTAVNAAATFLAELGVQSGDRVAACAANHPDIVIAFLATQRIGAIWVGINRVLAAPEKSFLLNDTGAKVLLADKPILDQLEAVRDDLVDLKATVDFGTGSKNTAWSQALSSFDGVDPPSADIDPYAPAAIAYTSGTTGVPKGAVHSQHNILVLGAAARSHGRQGQWAPELRRGVALPLTILNLMALGPVTAFVNRATCVCMDRIDAVGIAEWVRQEKIETFAGAPATIYDLLTKPEIVQHDLSSLVIPTAGGGHITDELRALYRERFGVELGIGYGLTEAMASVAEVDVSAQLVPNACGKAYPHLRLSIRDPDGAELPANTVGEICIEAVSAGPWAHVYSPMLGYWRRPDATAAALRGGVLHTGDLGCLDEHGHLFVKDRKSDLIIRGGANVYPAELERVVQEDERVAACAVVGAPDARLGEIVIAFVQPASGVRDRGRLVQDLRDRCAERLAKYKHPERWIVVDELPRNAMNKIVKSGLKERAASLGSAVANA